MSFCEAAAELAFFEVSEQPPVEPFHIRVELPIQVSDFSVGLACPGRYDCPTEES
jgi:hypothetical protein